MSPRAHWPTRLLLALAYALGAPTAAAAPADEPDSSSSTSSSSIEARGSDGGLARIGSRTLPNPTDPRNLDVCRIGRPAAICDPDGVLGPAGAARVAGAIEAIRARIRVPCLAAGGSAERHSVWSQSQRA
jgi:hypothetical protein